MSPNGWTARGTTAHPRIPRSCSSQALIDSSSRRTVLWGSLILSNNSSSFLSQQQRQPQRASLQAAAMHSKRIDAHVHVWASVQDARSGKYPYFVSDTGFGPLLGLTCELYSGTILHLARQGAESLICICRDRCWAVVTPRTSLLCQDMQKCCWKRCR
jgi:hypothetical protein